MARTPKGKQAQPGAVVASTLAIEPRPGHYRAGMYVELQKFGDSKRDQLMLWPDDQEQELPSPVTVTGLDLSVSEDRALSAIQILLDRTDYQGNRASRPVQSPAYQGAYDLPILAVTYPEYLEAYGLTRGASGHFSRRWQDEALEALESLAQARHICYRRRKVVKGKELVDVIRHTGPVLEITRGWSDLVQEEADAVERGADLPERMRGMVITVSPLVVEGLRTFFLLKPVELHNEIKQLRGSRAPRAVSLFIQWLLTLDKSTWQVARETLIDKLRLSDLYHRQRQKARVDKQIQEALATAKELAYLLTYQEERPGVIKLTLNPERCSRIRKAGAGQ